MREENSRDLGIILVFLLIGLILNSIILITLINNDIIKTKDINTIKNNQILFESNNEKVKKYVIPIFIVFCILLFAFSKLKNEQSR